MRRRRDLCQGWEVGGRCLCQGLLGEEEEGSMSGVAWGGGVSVRGC